MRTALSAAWVMLLLSCEEQRPEGEGGEVAVARAALSVSSCAQLQAIKNNLAGYYRLTTDVDCTGFDAGDGYGFQPIGDLWGDRFTGYFDGDGHVITGLAMDRSHFTGLFGAIDGAVVERVGLVDVEIVGDVSVAAVVGEAVASTVRQVYASGTVTGSAFVGGVVGALDEASTLEDSYSMVVVTSEYSRGQVAGWVNGTVKRSYGAASEPANVATVDWGAIEHSFYDCDVANDCSADGARSTLAMSSPTTFLDAGWNFDDTWGFTVSSSYPCLRWQDGCGCVASRDSDGDGSNDCADECVADPTKTAPGTCGCGSPDVDSDGDGPLDCDDPCRNDPNKVQPGVCGCNEPDVDADNDGLLNCNDPDWPQAVRDCAELQAMSADLAGNYRLVANVDCTGFDFGDGDGFLPIGSRGEGAFTGRFDGNGYTVTGLRINRNWEDVGLFGAIEGAVVERVGLVDADIHGYIAVGSLVGFSTASTIRESYAIGALSGWATLGGLIGELDAQSAVSDCYADVSVTGDYDMGLLVGRLDGDVSRCYSHGDAPARLGTVVDGAFTSSFYDCDVAGDCSDVGATSTADMTTQSTYTGWDFTGVWDFGPSGYPCLRWQADCRCVPGRDYDGDGASDCADPNILGYWSFDEASGNTVLDSSAVPTHGALVNATRDTNGRLGGAVYFNGTSSRISIPSGAWNIGTNVTYSAWYKADGIPKGMVFDHRHTGIVTGSFAFRPIAFSGATYDHVQFGAYDSTGTGRSASFVGTTPPGEWAMVTVVITPTEMRLFKNGAPLGSTTIVGGLPAIGGPLYIGSRGEIPDNFFKGWIDEFAVYGRAMSDTEVAELYQQYGEAPSPPWNSTGGLVGRWSFDEGSGTTTSDVSGFGNTGTLQGGTAWDTNCVAGSCLRFNGTNSKVRVPDGIWNQATPGTFVLWYKRDAAPTGNFLMEHMLGANNAGAFVLRADGGGYSAYETRTQSRSGTGWTTPAIGVWRMMAVTTTPTELKMYRDGVLVGTTPMNGGPPYIPGDLYFGARGVENDNFFKGWIDEVSVYARALSAGEIGDLYRDTLSSPYPGCEDDDDCPPGLVCGFGIGPKFGHAEDQGVCWNPDICTLPNTQCGTPNALCGLDCCVPTCGEAGTPNGCGRNCQACVPGADSDGDGLTDCEEGEDPYTWTDPLVQNEPCGNGSVDLGEACDTALTGSCSFDCASEAPPAVCSSDSDCPLGQECGLWNGAEPGLDPALTVCIPMVPCRTAPHLSCGFEGAQCGECQCVRDCSEKSCGDDADSGCGHPCTAFCDPYEGGCTSDSDCPAAHFCAFGAGARVGLDEGVNVCLPIECNDYVASRTDCGEASDPCGTCPAHELVLYGEDRCEGGCAEGLYCSMDGNCMPRWASYRPNALTFAPDVPTAEVGAIPGSFGVGSAGSAEYTVPIEVPPGRAGMQPQLTLRYDSSAGDSFVGKGWSITGLPAIERCPKTYASNGERVGVRLRQDDAYCFNGQQLVLVNEADYGGEGAEYRTELDTFTKFTSLGSTFDAVGNSAGPETFEARTKEGRILRFGTLPGSRRLKGGAALAWYVSEFEDHSGNGIKVLYEEWYRDVGGAFGGADVEENRPIAIYYTTHTSNSDASRSIVFHYDNEEKNLIPRRFVAGNALRASSPLQRIETFVENKLVRTYKFQTRKVGATWLLDALHMCVPATGGERCIPPTLFFYDENGADLASPAGHEAVGHLPGDEKGDAPWQGQSSPASVSDRERILGGESVAFDFDGDGDDDLLEAVPTDVSRPKHRYVLRTSLGGISGNGDFFADGFEPDVVSTDNVNVWQVLLDCHGFSVLDFDADGRDDLAAVCPNNPTTDEPREHRRLFLSNRASGFTTIKMEGDPLALAAGRKFHGSSLDYDLNGDGRNDYVVTHAVETCETRSSGGFNPQDYEYCTTHGPYRVAWRENKGPQNPGGMLAPLQVIVDTDALTPMTASDVDGDGVVDFSFDAGIFFPNSRETLHLNGQGVAQFKQLKYEQALSRPMRTPIYPTRDIGVDANGDGLSDTVQITTYTCGFSLGPYQPVDMWLQLANGSGGLTAGRAPLVEFYWLGFSWLSEFEQCQYFAVPPTFAMDRDNDRRSELYMAPGAALGDYWFEYTLLDTNTEAFTNKRESAFPFITRGPDPNVWEPPDDNGWMRFRDEHVNKVVPWRSWQRPIVMDVNGDGVKDLVSRTGNEQEVWMEARLATSRTRHLLKGITETGLLRTTNVGYEVASSGTGTRAYTRGLACAYPQRCEKKTPNAVVAEHRVTGYGGPYRNPANPANQAITRRFEYTYSDGRSDLRGRGWLGFGKREVKEIVPGATPTTWSTLSTTTYAYDLDTYDNGLRKYWKAGSPETVTTYQVTSGSELTDFEPTIHLSSISSDAGLRTSEAGRPYIAPLKTQRDKFENDVLVSRSWTDYEAYDAHGNLVRSIERSGAAGEGPVTMTTTSYRSPDLDEWLVGVPTSVTVIGAINPDTIDIKTVQFEYSAHDDRGLPHVITRRGSVGLAPLADKLVTQLEYDAYGNERVANAVSQTGAGSSASTPHRMSTTTYDPQGYFPVLVENADHAAEGIPGTTLRYDARSGALLYEEQPSGDWVAYDYDGVGRLQWSRDGADRTTTVTYSLGREVDGATQVQVSSTASPAVTTEYNSFGQVVLERIVRVLNQETWQEYGYDERGQLITVGVPHFASAQSPAATRYRYDQMGRVIERTSPWQAPDNVQVPDHQTIRTATTTYQYLSDGTSANAPADAWLNLPGATRVVVTDDPAENRTASAVDMRGNVVGEIDAQGIVAYTYGPFEHLRQVSFDGVSTVIESDELDQPTRYEEPSRGVYEFVYNGFGNVDTTTRSPGTADEQVTSNTYDGIGRLRATARPDGNYAWVFDRSGEATAPSEFGRLVRMSVSSDSFGDHSTSYEYDGPGGELSAIVRSIDGHATPFRTELDYNSNALIDTITYPGPTGLRVKATYNGFGQVTSVEDADDSTLPEFWTLGALDQFGAVATADYGNGAQTELSREVATGLLKRARVFNGAQAIQDQLFLHDERGLLTYRGQPDAITGDVYRYDGLGRLETHTPPSGNPEIYAYDARGNLIHNPVVGTLSYDGAVRDQVSSTSLGHAFLYDAYGNQNWRLLPPSTIQSVEYTSFDLPLAITEFNGETQVLSTTFKYDASGTRVVREVDNGDSTTYVGDLYRQEVHAGGPVEHIASVPLPDGTTLEISIDGENRDYFYAHGDDQGSTVAVGNENGGLAESRSYLPFGRPQQASWSTTVLGGYTGHEHDRASQLVNMRGRIYDPDIGRFLSADPSLHGLAHSQGQNPYSYVLNSPTNLIDQSGFEEDCKSRPGCTEYKFDDHRVEGTAPKQSPQPPPTPPGPPPPPPPTPSVPSEPDLSALDQLRPEVGESPSAQGVERDPSGGGALQEQGFDVGKFFAGALRGLSFGRDPFDELGVRQEHGDEGEFWHGYVIGRALAVSAEARTEARGKPPGRNKLGIAMRAWRPRQPGAAKGTRAVKAVGPGPHAAESIPARGPERDFTAEERARVNEIGRATGCHTCGEKDPGTKSGNFVLDHQPPNKLNTTGAAQRLFPHCIRCSRVQGGEVNNL